MKPENINMRRVDMRLFWGLLLVAGGALFLLQNLGFLPFGEYVWALLFAAAGISFMAFFLTDRANWWAVIPGLVLLGLGAVIALSVAFPEDTPSWIGAVFLGIIGLAFWLVYLTNGAFWWAVIPAGVMTTLALVAGGSAIFGGFEMGGLFFMGLGLTFALVGVLPTPEGRMSWAFIPASILMVMGLLIMAAATSLINLIWPVALIAVGGFMLYRAFIYRRG
jgi:hypothetical protein